MRTSTATTPPAFRHEHILLLKGLLVACIIILGLVAAYWAGVLRQVVQADRTGISIAITILFLIAYVHGGAHLVRLSRHLNHFGAVRRALLEDRGAALPLGCVSGYVRSLETKARLSGQSAIDQRLLLQSFEGRLRRGHGLSWFVADVLLSLGLLGTVIGFISMLAPISGLEAADHAAIKGALGAMSDGMAVALYTTLTGLIGGLILRVQGLLLDRAVDDLVDGTIELTEVHVLPAIERSFGDAQTS